MAYFCHHCEPDNKIELLRIQQIELLYGEEPVIVEEIKLQRARTWLEAIYSPTEVDSKDLLEPERMKAVDNLQSYQNEMRAWRDKKVKQKSIEVGYLVLLQCPHKEASSNCSTHDSLLLLYIYHQIKVGCMGHTFAMNISKG
jgi:hypothetical protein